MNQTNSNTTLASTTQQSDGVSVCHADLELAAITLISQLEVQIQKAIDRGSHVEKASEIADKLLTLLLDFSERNLSEESANTALKDVEKASFSSLAHREVLNSLSWGFAISNLFGKSVCSDERVRQTYDRLGEDLLGACVSTLRQAVGAVGPESTQAETIEQSIAVFVEEFRTSW